MMFASHERGRMMITSCACATDSGMPCRQIRLRQCCEGQMAMLRLLTGTDSLKAQS